MKKATIIVMFILLSWAAGVAQDNYGIQKIGSVYNCWSNIRQIEQENGFLYINAYGAGLQIMDARDPANPEIVAQNIGYWRSPYVIDGEYLYAMTSDSIVAYDASDNQNIQRIGSYPYYRPRDLAMSDGIMYLHHYIYEDRELYHTLSIIDFTDPADAQLLSETRELCTEIMQVQGNLLYCQNSGRDPDYFQRFAIFDVSDPEDIILLDQTERVHTIQSIRVRNGVAYVVESDSVLTIYDVSDPTDIQSISSIDNLGSIFNIFTVDDYVFTVGRIVASIDVSDLENPVVVDSVENVETENLTNSTLSGNTLAVSNYNHPRLSLIDVSDPTDLTVVYERKTPRYVLDVLPANDYAYVLFYKGGFGIVDISDPTHPAEVSYLDFPQGNRNQYSLVKMDNWILCPYYQNSPRIMGLNIIDVSDPMHPEIVVTDTIGRVNDLALQGQVLFVANSDNGLRILDVSDPENPRQIALFVSLGSCVDVKVKGDYVYLIQHVTMVVGERVNYYVLLTVDISDIEQPHETDNIGLGDANPCHFVDSSNDLILTSDREFRTYSLADPAEPELLRTFRTEQALSGGMTTLGDDYLIFGSTNLTAYKLTDELGRPKAPELVGYYDNPGRCYKLEIQDNLLFVADQTNLGIYDISEIIGWQGIYASEPCPVPAMPFLTASPNPFNSVTQLNFSLLVGGWVNLSVYDVEGRKVATLYDGEQSAGMNAVSWNAGGMPSGLYIVRVTTASGISEAKVLLMG